VIALLLGRFHALTRGQAELVASLSQEVGPAHVDRIVCVVTSADHSGTRRNPLDIETREALLRPALAATGKPFDLVRVNDIPDDARWVEHVRASVQAQTGVELSPAATTLLSANREVQALFAAAGFGTVKTPAGGLTPTELIERIATGKQWRSEAAPSTIAVYEARAVPEALAKIFAEKLRTEDGELATHRDFASYGAQMDASLVQKLEDLLPWVKPPRIVDKGCGTGKLMVELSRRFPGASIVGVDLSRELLRRSDENTYAGGDITLVLGDAADQQLPDGSADTVIFSSIMHEVYSYSGYDRARIDRALASAARELKPGGRVLIRDGISPDPRTVLLDLMDAPTAAQFERFAREFKHGLGARFERVAARDWAVATVRLAAHDANEFVCKKDYLKNWDIEIHEEYGVFTVDEWRAALARNFFGVVTISSYVNTWIQQHRYQGHVRVTELNGTSFWPATNAVIIGERQ